MLVLVSSVNTDSTQKTKARQSLNFCCYDAFFKTFKYKGTQKESVRPSQGKNKAAKAM